MVSCSRTPRSRSSRTCGDGFTATGLTSLASARIGGRLVLSGATLVDPAGAALDAEDMTAGQAVNTYSRPALDAELLHVEQDALIELDAHSLNPDGARIDHPDSWPSQVFLHGFTCDRIQDGNTPVRDRIEYLRGHADGGYEPGLYDNLAAAHRRDGRVERARLVSMARQRHRRTELNPVVYAFDVLLPIVDLGQEKARVLTTAVVAGLTDALKRD